MFVILIHVTLICTVLIGDVSQLTQALDVKRVAPHRQTCLLCASKSVDAIVKAVLTLIRNEKLCWHLCENAFSHALDNLTFDKMMEGMLESYRKALVSL